MKKNVLALVLLAGALGVKAQSVHVAPGKKVQVQAIAKYTTTVSQMGQEFEIPATGETTTDVEVKSVNGTKVDFAVTLKRMKASTTVMGNEQVFDSDDKTTASNPMMAEAMKEVNKTVEVSADAAKPAPFKDATGTQNVDEIASYILLPVDAAHIKENYSWTDSVATDGVKTVNKYTVTSITKEDVVVTVATTSNITGTKQQMGMEVKMNMKLASESKRVYDIASGLLKSETRTFSSSGVNEAMGQSIPVSVKGTTDLTVK